MDATDRVLDQALTDAAELTRKLVWIRGRMNYGTWNWDRADAAAGNALAVQRIVENIMKSREETNRG